MNINALFDKLAVDLEASGAVEQAVAHAPEQDRAQDLAQDLDGSQPTATIGAGAGGQGVQERVLTHEGTPFARLRDETMAFYLPPGTPSLPDALALESSRPVGDGEWVEVPADDVSRWPILAEQSLAALRRG